MLKVNNRSTKARCGICSKLTIKTPERRQWHLSGVFIVNFEHISHLVLVREFLFLTYNGKIPFGLEPSRTSMIELINSIKDIQLGCKYTSDIQTFERKNQQKFISCQNKLLANSLF